LTTLARSSRRPAFGAIFLLNNAFYLNSRLIESSQTELIRLLAKPTQDALQSATRTAKAGYFDANFSPLMQNLADDRDKSKGGMKEKFTRFFDLLEEVVERHKHAHVLEDDEEARETIAEEVVKLVVPSFQRFTQRTKEKEFSKSTYLYPYF
jgi:exocyst complex component 7